MVEIFEFSGDKDMANQRVVTLEDKEKTRIQLERYDPYGFVRMIWKNGKTPEHFKDANFTSFEEARKALDAYLNGTKR